MNPNDNGGPIIESADDTLTPSKVLIGKDVVLSRLGDPITIPTVHGDRPAIKVQALILDGDNEYRNAGTVVIFWMAVMRQIADKKIGTWAAGSIVQGESKGAKSGAYRLVTWPADDPRWGYAQAAVSSHLDNPKPVMEIEPDSAPF